MKTICLVSFALLALCSCATQYGTSYLPTAEDALSDRYGAIVHVTVSTGEQIDGELLAVSRDSLFVVTPVGFQAVQRSTISTVYGNTFDRGSIVTLYTTSTILGMFSSVSAGGPGILIILPLYLICGAISTNMAASISRISYIPGMNEEQDWTRLGLWSRFPAGLPQRLNRDFVRLRPEKT